jgi:pimeloyl-ACP methyl ester carboxylesterase
VDAAATDHDPEGLARIGVPVILGVGAASEPFYAPIATALQDRIAGARVATIPELRHFAPIVTPAPVADLIRSVLVPVIQESMP